MTVASSIAVEPESGMNGFARKMVGLYIFLLFGRILEFLGVLGLGQLRPMMLVTSAALLLVIVSGNVVRALRTPLGVLLAVFTFWMVVCMPFSSWRAETLNQFASIWLKSLAVFFIVAGLGSTAASFDRVITAMGWAAAACSLLIIPGWQNAGTGNGVTDRLLGVGSLSNPNEVAFHLWLGMPFLVLLAVRSGLLKRIFLFAVCAVELLLIVKTVSREGLLLAVVLFGLTMLRVSVGKKLQLAIAALMICAAGLSVLSRESIDRYLTLFTSKVSSEAAASASASSKLRHQKLRESIELTIRHPIFGVGMGVFMPASVDLAKELGTRQDWEVSHNGYTQVSSELGFPGLLLLLAIFGTAFRQLWQIDRAAKRSGRADARQQVFAVLLGLAVLAVHFCFDSIAYVFYLPLVTGLVSAIAVVYEPQALLASAGDAVPEPEPEAVNRFASDVPGRIKSSSEARVVAARARNPYRLGRRRSS